MIKSATLDPSKLLYLYFRKNRAGTKKFIFLDDDGNPFDISSIDFELFVVNNAGSRGKLISLTIGSGLTVGGAGSNELTATVTSDDTNLNEGACYWELYRTDTEKTWLNGKAVFHVGEFDGVNETNSLTISDGVDTVTITVDDSVNAPLVNAAYSTALTFDFDKAIYQDVTTPTFTLASSGNINGVGIILKLNTPTSVTFPASFTAHPNSATLDATKLNVYSLVYFSDWDGAGTAKVVYTNSLFTAI
jgi:hypothetical protein